MLDALLYSGGIAALIASVYIAVETWIFFRDLPQITTRSRIDQGDE